MSFADHYLAKHYKDIISVTSLPHKDLSIIVIIPAFDEPGLTLALESLFKCRKPKGKTEVLILINWPDTVPETVKQQNLSFYESLKTWINTHTSELVSFHSLIYPDIQDKNAGVGLARKILMDEAVRRFNLLSRPDGIIASFDADALCEENYLTELENHFKRNPSADGCVIYFEHPLTGDEFAPSVYKAVCLYELHLRYYVQSIRYTGFRNAYHTVGSSFAVRADAYCRQGGMNKRKAGEDFYFLQKFFELGHFTELNSTCIIPSPRPSNRVPFGTGAVIRDFVNGNKNEFLTYNPDLFDILAGFFNKIPELYSHRKNTNPDSLLYDMPSLLQNFLKKEGFHEAVKEIVSNSATLSSFEKRFFRWFNLLKILKFLNYGKKWYPEVPVTTAASKLLLKKRMISKPEENPVRLLNTYRIWERNTLQS